MAGVFPVRWCVLVMAQHTASQQVSVAGVRRASEYLFRVLIPTVDLPIDHVTIASNACKRQGAITNIKLPEIPL